MLPTAREAPGACSSSFIDGLSQTPLPRCLTRTPLLGRESAGGGLQGMTSALGLRQDWVPSGFSRGREGLTAVLGNGASSSFAVRCVSASRGLAMFAAQDIEAGDIIFEERPLVSTCSGCLPDATCISCMAPTHDLRRHLCSMSSSNLTRARLPGIDHTEGPVFCGANDAIACPEGCGRSWCSEDCKNQNSGCILHRLLECCGNENNSTNRTRQLCITFGDHALETNEPSLPLAGQAIAVVVSKIITAAINIGLEGNGTGKVAYFKWQVDELRRTILSSGMLWWQEYVREVVDSSRRI